MEETRQWDRRDDGGVTQDIHRSWLGDWRIKQRQEQDIANADQANH